jgi:hypothetical protein
MVRSAYMVAQFGNVGDTFGLDTYSVIGDNLSFGPLGIIVNIDIVSSPGVGEPG